MSGQDGHLAVLIEMQWTKIDSKCTIISYRYKHASKMDLGLKIKKL